MMSWFFQLLGAIAQQQAGEGGGAPSYSGFSGIRSGIQSGIRSGITRD